MLHVLSCGVAGFLLFKEYCDSLRHRAVNPIDVPQLDFYIEVRYFLRLIVCDSFHHFLRLCVIMGAAAAAAAAAAASHRADIVF